MSKTYMMEYIIQNSQYLIQEDKNDIVKIVKDNTEDAAIMEQNKKRKNDIDRGLQKMEVPNAEVYSCSRCHKKFYLNGFKINRLGVRNKSCIECSKRGIKSRENNKCEHKKRKNECKECGGSQICEHKKIRSQCKECEGGSICIHQRRRSQCKECEGGSICEHKRIRSHCFKCDPCSALWARASCRIIRAIGSELRAGRTTEQLLGCDKQTFFNHIESLFKEGMSWNNIELIDIDHVVPIKYKGADGMQPTLNEMIQRFHYQNCQPLYRNDNKIKSNKLNLDELLDELLNEVPSTLTSCAEILTENL